MYFYKDCKLCRDVLVEFYLWSGLFYSKILKQGFISEKKLNFNTEKVMKPYYAVNIFRKYFSKYFQSDQSE